eukprot:CAMPEP_0171316134 /NCGR_PEP_ID=MMETSP0816-20121228/70418_1 /TAXON_ID=420281 /ORGANISM="Proboscia inermis, Strain CCAP1064/1" /LENGTH=101 /DNA_ID=CAMNT_0011807693 /DNA_START=8 /DNA_END=313 /DNA_ORIENTATION=+
MAVHFVKHGMDESEWTSDDINEGHEKLAKDIAEDDNKCWESLPSDQKMARKWIEMLLEKNFRLFISPVEFVDYDEEVYKMLIEIDADSGEVSLNEEQLGPL